VGDMLTRAVRQLKQATEIVKDLADLTRGGELKKENLAREDLNEVIGKLVEHQKGLADSRSIDLKVMLPEPPVIMTTNRSMAEAIASNLIGNAVRYCREGGRISVRLVDTGKLVRLVVEDDGIGIPPEDQERIFEEFYRTSAAQEVSDLGTGLGLAIVKKYVTDLGGRIEVQSEPGQGATFTVVLPRRSRAKLASAGEEGGS
jgi:signal transduction histidine kinase